MKAEGKDSISGPTLRRAQSDLNQTREYID